MVVVNLYFDSVRVSQSKSFLAATPNHFLFLFGLICPKTLAFPGFSSVLPFSLPPLFFSRLTAEYHLMKPVQIFFCSVAMPLTSTT